jgi:proline-specific peptidase
MKQTLLFLLLVVWLVQVSFALLGPNKLSHHRSFRAVLNAKISVKRGTEVFSIDYDVIHRQAGEIPVIVIHGGPSLPSNYLYPMKDLVENRSLVFYDQLGCGKSDEPKDLSHYSIDKSVDDLVELLRVLNLPKFHLYGHSYGGILAFEYVKRVSKVCYIAIFKLST